MGFSVQKSRSLQPYMFLHNHQEIRMIKWRIIDPISNIQWSNILIILYISYICQKIAWTVCTENVKFCCLIITHCPAKDQLKTNIKHHNQQNKILPEIQYMYSNKTSIKVCEKIGINIVKKLKFVSKKFMAAMSVQTHVIIFHTILTVAQNTQIA